MYFKSLLSYYLDNLTAHLLSNSCAGFCSLLKCESTGNAGEYAYLSANISSYNDYYPFGMPMPERNGSLEQYRFGFNRQEKVNEIAGAGNFNEFKYRIHDARLGRFMSVDPLHKEYSWNSTYAFAENRVIDGVDLEGGEYVHYSVFLTKDGEYIKKVITEDFTKLSYC